MKRNITLVLTSLIILILYISLSSSSGGINGQSVAGCTCHGAASPNTLLTIGGLPSGGYTNGTVYSLTLSVTNNTFPGSAGFDLTTSAGAFTAVTGTALNGPLEIRHSVPKLRVGGTASWVFNWTAPASGNANVTFAVSGNAVNSDGNTTGDQWNQISTTLYKSGAVLAVTASGSAITCFGGLSTITATGTGPIVPYQYSRNGGAFQSSGTFSNNLPGTYTITVRDAILATATTVLTITQPTDIVVGATATPIICNGATSTITATSSGGTGTKTYRLNLGTFQSSAIFLNNLAGTYTVTARDNNFCTKTTTVVITQPTAMTFTVPAVTPIICNGGTGGVSTTASGGTGAKTYTINPLGPQSNATGSFSGLTAQGYTVTATDANNCTKTTLITLTQPTAMTFGTPSITNPLCNGGTGSATVSASGGTGTKTYTISPLGPQSNTSGNFTGLTGTQVYTVTATDANSCTKTTTLTVTQPSLLIFGTPTITGPLCNGGVGTASVTASGGTGTKTYTISPLGPQSNTSGNFSGLTAQSYTITVTDANACTKTTTAIVSAPPPLTVTAMDAGGCAGTAIALTGTPAGGVFSVANPYTGPSTWYTYTYTNGSGCTNSDSAFISIQTVPLDNVTVLPPNVCLGGSSLLIVKPTGYNCIPSTLYTDCNFEYIAQVSFGSINRISACDTTGYHNYAATDNTTLVAGNTYSITLTEGVHYSGDIWHVFIDYNHNDVFDDPGEHTSVVAGGASSTLQIQVPTTAVNGQTRMRVRLVYVGPADACSTTSWGEAEDYGITITGGVTNNNPPFAFQWSNALHSTFLTPTNDSTLAANILDLESYLVTVTTSLGCTNSASAAVFPTPLNVIDSLTATPANVCPGGSSVLSFVNSYQSTNYCIPVNFFNGCANEEFIQNVSFGSINNTTVCDTIGYKDYTNLSTSLSAGSTYTISFTNGSYFLGDRWGVWIDYNHNKSFSDVGEFVEFSPNAALATGNIQIPSTAYNGPTRMRVRLTYVGFPDPCATSSWGETEDYTVNISGGVNAPPFMTYLWSNNQNSTLSSTTNAVVTASNITASEVYHITATRLDGCYDTDSLYVDVNCGSTVNLKLFLQGYYNGSSTMVPTLMNQGVGVSSTITDSITVELHDENSPYGIIQSKQAILNTNGTATCTFDSSGSRYLAVRHRNSIQTWSALPLTLTPITNYNFSDSVSKAYGGNMIEIETGVWAFYTGDLNDDENADLLDIALVETDISNFQFGYFATDINGDGNVDLLDSPALETNVNNFIFSNHP